MNDEMTFDVQVYLILSRTYGELDRLLSDTVTAIREIGYGTQTVNRYRYEQRTENPIDTGG